MRHDKKTISLCETIYHLAKNKDKDGLERIIADGASVDIYHDDGDHTAIMLLAEEGNNSSVEFLIDHFNASIFDAVQGYAMGGYTKEVNILISLFPHARVSAIKGYAFAGNKNELQLVDYDYTGISMTYYAKGGHHKIVSHRYA